MYTPTIFCSRCGVSHFLMFMFGKNYVLPLFFYGKRRIKYRDSDSGFDKCYSSVIILRIGVDKPFFCAIMWEEVIIC